MTSPLVIAVPKELAPGEQRVATVPEVVRNLIKSGCEVRVEHDAGAGSYYPDTMFAAAGAKIVSERAGLLDGARIVLRVQPPTVTDIDQLAEGTIVIGFMNAANNLEAIKKNARPEDHRLFSRTGPTHLPRPEYGCAQLAGYGGRVCRGHPGCRELPEIPPDADNRRGYRSDPPPCWFWAQAIAGLMAIATAKRLGALVEAYDVRRAAGEQVRSLGAKFLELEINAEGQGGYARELTAEEKVKEQEMVSAAVARADIVITTAAIPGRKAPVLITKETVAKMQPGAVIIDMAAETGGNCELTASRKNRQGAWCYDHRPAEPPGPGTVPRKPDVRKEPSVVPLAPHR